MMRRPTDILGYCQPLAVHPGGTTELKISSNGPATCDIGIFRVICADIDPNGPGAEFEQQEWCAHPDVDIFHQPINAGSYALSLKTPEIDWSVPFEFTAYLWPTCVDGGLQAVLSWGGLEVGINRQGRLYAKYGSDEVCCSTALLERRWIKICLSVNPQTQRMFLSYERQTKPGMLSEADRAVSDLDRKHLIPGDNAPLIFAASATGDKAATGTRLSSTRHHFNGKIDSPAIWQQKTAICEWDFSRNQSGNTACDTGMQGCDLILVNGPMRAATGHRWKGDTESWVHHPDQYSAIHFHDDDLTDCHWKTTRKIDIPADARSGYYIARMTTSQCTSDVAFFVSERAEQNTDKKTAGKTEAADILFIAPTATYLSYANTHIKFDSHNTENLYEAPMVISEEEMYLNEHRELGLSHYDTHSDNSGVVHVSERRPMLNMKPGLYTFNYVNDTHIIKWLEAKNFRYEVATDKELHEHGAALLSRYRVIITASHPEYYSTPMWDAVHEFQEQGGRHLYLGGNGFYWRIGWSENMPGVMENRRGNSGVRTWEGEPGEHYLASTGEPGGLWRSSGRAPQSLVGVGFSSTVFVRSTYYKRTPASFDKRVSFIFDGVEDEKIGDFGYRGGGAVGLEIDRFDVHLGSQHDAIVVATSHGIDKGGLLSGEEFITTTRALDGDQNGLVRADMVIFATQGNGAVWSVGSIAWPTSMTWNDCENNVSKITENVLKRFCDPAPV